MKVTDSCSAYVLTEMHVEPSLRAKRMYELGSKKSEHGRPYRKPTQVVEESILRRSSDPWLRNSANWSCNFGRRDAYSFGRGRSEEAQATVYQKHMALRIRKTTYKA